MPSTNLSKPESVPDIVALYSYVSVQVWAGAVRRSRRWRSRRRLPRCCGRENSQQLLDASHSTKKVTGANVSYSVVTRQAGTLDGATMAQQDACDNTTGRRSCCQPSLRRPQPKTFYDLKNQSRSSRSPCNGNTIKQLADSVPLFPPVEGQSDALWKKNCSNVSQVGPTDALPTGRQLCGQSPECAAPAASLRRAFQSRSDALVQEWLPVN